MGNSSEPSPLDAVRVAEFSGRKNTQFSIWDDIANELKNRQGFYGALFPIENVQRR